MKPRFLIKSGYYIVPNPSTTLFIGKDCQVEEGLGHAFLILSRSDQTTMVLQTGQEINELDKGQSGFITDGPTVFCGNLGKLIETIPILCLYSAVLDFFGPTHFVSINTILLTQGPIHEIFTKIF